MWTVRMTAAIAIAVLVMGAAPAAGSADESPPDSAVKVTATFEGEEFDITGDWGDAAHCVVTEIDRVECFRTRSDAARLDGGPTDADLAELRRAAIRAAGPAGESELGGGAVAMSSGCTLTLFANSYFGGSSISFTSTGIRYSMATYGFDQKASSWTEPGSCSVEFWDYRDGFVYEGHAGPFSAGADCCLWNNYWDTGGTIDNDISYARMN